MLKKTLIFVAVTFVLSSHSLSADTPAPVLSPKLRAKLMRVPEFGQIVRVSPKTIDSNQYCDSNVMGSVCYMPQSEAIRYCREEEQGSHLPTAREWALYESAHFATPPVLNIGEWSFGGGYMRLETTALNSGPDVFYASRFNYQRPGGDAGRNIFWTASRNLINISANPRVKPAYVFHGSYGYLFGDIDASTREAVICAKNQ
jgi:hypothetical protein